MLKYFLAAGALVVAGVPAAVGLSGNASFDRDVPVRVPEQAQTVAPSPTGSVDDDGTPDQGPGDFGTTEAEPGDDHGGLTPDDDATEGPDDDGDGHHGRHHDGADDDADDVGDDHGGDDGGDDDRSGSNSGSDDGGHHGGGSDDGSGHD